jgi:hypothetical protein
VTPPAGAAAVAAPARRARTAAPARPRIAPPRPARRVSGPARPVRPPAKRSSSTGQPHAQAERGLVLGVLGALDGVSRSGALDRLIRGRIWIAVIAFSLIGIVTLQLLVLQLNASIGRSLVREAQLQRANAALSIESSELSAGERVESQAGRIGMQLVPLNGLRFLTASPRGDVARAAAALKAPVHAAGSGEAGAAATQTASATTATTAAPASGEQAPSGEASTGSSTQTTTPTGETGTSGGEANAPSSEASVSGAASTTSAPSSTEGAAAPTETSTAGTVGGAGGVGAGQPSGAG